MLDNIDSPNLMTAQETDTLTSLGAASLHLTLTTRLAPRANFTWLTVGELPEADALALLEKHRPFADDAERQAAQTIVRRLGCFSLAVELVPRIWRFTEARSARPWR